MSAQKEVVQVHVCCTERVQMRECAHTVRGERLLICIFLCMHTEETDALGMEVRVCRRQRASRSKAQTEKQEKCVLFPLCSIKWDFVCS